MNNHGETLAIVRRAVRQVVESTPALKTDRTLARQIANRMVTVSLSAANLISAEQKLNHEISQQQREKPSQPLAMAQASASDIHGQTAVRSAAGTVKALKNAIDFPEFVTSLINGVFQSIQNSNIQQLTAFADLLEAVNLSSDEFGTQKIGKAQAAQWAASRFPAAMKIEINGDDLQLVLTDNGEMPERAELMEALEADTTEIDNIDDSDLTTTFLPLIQRKLARNRQAVLSTMIMMGLQRVVVDDGQLHASMRMQVDARSIAERAKLDSVDSRITTEAGGSFGVGAWGASAKMSANVGFVHSDEQFTREDIAASAGLRSSVDLRFRSVPLDVTRMAKSRSLLNIQNKSLVPEREKALGSLLTDKPDRATTKPKAPSKPDTATMQKGADTQLSKAEKARKEAQKNKAGDNKSKNKVENKSKTKTTPKPNKQNTSKKVGNPFTVPVSMPEYFTVHCVNPLHANNKQTNSEHASTAPFTDNKTTNNRFLQLPMRCRQNNINRL